MSKSDHDDSTMPRHAPEPRRLSARLAFAMVGLICVPAAADTIVLKSGKRIENVVTVQDGDHVVINPWNSRNRDMRWEIPDKNRIPMSQVEEVIEGDAPPVELRRRSARGDLTADEHFELVQLAEEHGLKAERLHHLRLTLCKDPEHAAALKALGSGKWTTWAKGNALADRELAALESEYVALADAAALKAQLSMLKSGGSKRELTYLERARRSAEQPKGRRDKVPLTLRSDQAPGANYSVYVPRSYDPLRPTPLVVGLHGGGRGGDDGIVSGSGDAAMNWYTDQAEKRGWLVVCPTALAAPWGSKANGPWLDALLEEAKLLYNVDESRIYLVGHSMGGFGTWHWGPARSEVWAACAPCAGGGGPNGVASKGLPIYIFHGADDGVVGVGSDRNAAKSLGSGKKPHDFVYTELNGVGHGFPAWVREDIFRFFAGRTKSLGRKRVAGPRSSFDRKVSKEEKKTFGDPSKVDAREDDDGVALKDLVAALIKGGGGAAEAVDALASMKDAKTAKAVAKVLRSPKVSVDSRVHAARALGRIGVPESVKALEKGIRDEDFRVVEAVAWALGETRLPEAASPLAKAIAELGSRFEAAVQNNAIVFREYEVRIGCLVTGVDAAAKLKDVDALMPALQSEVVERVLGRKERLTVRGEKDPRFTQNPPRARMLLGRSLRACLSSWGDRRGLPLLDAVAEHWRDAQPRLAQEMDQGLSDL